MRSFPAVLACVLAIVALSASSAGSKTLPRPARAGLDTALVHIGATDAGTQAFVAWPAKHAGAPAIVVVHEWWGLDGQIRDVARRLAREGYVAIVPDLYHGQVATDPEEAHELSRAMQDEGAMTELESAVAWLHDTPETAKSKIGVLGFCMGGGLSMGLALKDSSLSAAVMFYGVPVTDAQALAALHAPLQAHFGATDKGIPPSRADDLRDALKAAGKTGEVYVYPGAGHAFMNEARPSYHPDAARQGWARMLAFLQRNLKG